MRVGIGLAAGIAVASVAPLEAAGGPFEKGPYLQNVSRTSVTVMWESSRAVSGSVRIVGQKPGQIYRSDETDIHEVRIDGLEPSRRYRYVVECGGETARGEFATAPEADQPFSFVVFGDSRSNVGSHSRVAERVAREVPDFILGTGDMVDDGARENEWQAFFEIERDLLRENVLFPSVGNHDRQGRGRTADNYRKYFSLPENSPDPERYYAFTYGNARFLILDSNAYSFSLTDQTAWIEQQLQAARLDPNVEHIFVSMHHPPYSISLHGGQRELRERWTPLYEKYRVTAVFSGHDHVYSRAEKNGVRYFVSGGGGAPLYPRKRDSARIDLEATRFFERTNHFLRVSVVGEFVEVSAIRADGSLIETASWGTLPPADEVIAGIGAGDDDGAPARDPAPQIEVPPQVAAAAPASGRREGFGPMGILGGFLVLLAGGVLVWSLRLRG